jgi:hypothetical protein
VPSWKLDRIAPRRALVSASVVAWLSAGNAWAQTPAHTNPRPSDAHAPRGVARVVVSAPSDAPALLQEALVRAQGELSAVGLGAEIQRRGPQGSPAPRLDSDVYGLLELEERGRWLFIHAWAPHAEQAVDARVDLAGAGVTAEVIAVRAVETLRAAMLEFARSEQGRVPEVVRGFTRFEPPPRQTEPPTQTEPTRPAARRQARELPPPLVVWVGPAVSLHAGTSPDLGLQLGVLVGGSHLFAAAAFESTLYDLHLTAAHGSAEAKRQAAWIQVGARFRPSHSWEVATRGGAGYAAFSIRGDGDPGYRGLTSSHGSPAVMLGVSTTYWATRGFGVYASVGGRLALDAPTIVIANEQVITLDRPSFVVSLGVNVGVF